MTERMFWAIAITAVVAFLAGAGMAGERIKLWGCSANDVRPAVYTFDEYR